MCRCFLKALIKIYIMIPIALALGTYRGWLFQSSTPDTTNTTIVVFGLIALFAATMLAEHVGAFAVQPEVATF